MEELKVKLWFVVRETFGGPTVVAACLYQEDAKSKFRAARAGYKESIDIIEGEGILQVGPEKN